MKKYVASISNRFNCRAEIVVVDVDKETDKSVWVSGRRQAKESEFEVFFDTWAEAHEGLLAAQEEKVHSLRLLLQHANGRLGQIKGMRPPDPDTADTQNAGSAPR